MTRIDFAFGARDRLRAACDAVYKHYRRGGHLVVYCTDQVLLERFDLMLWGFDATAFIPHVHVDDPLAEQTPVLLTNKPFSPHPDATPTPWLVNLDVSCAPELEHYERVLEIVPQDEDSIQAGRQRWRQYKNEGHDLHAHDVSLKAR